MVTKTIKRRKSPAAPTAEGSLRNRKKDVEEKLKQNDSKKRKYTENEQIKDRRKASFKEAGKGEKEYKAKPLPKMTNGMTEFGKERIDDQEFKETEYDDENTKKEERIKKVNKEEERNSEVESDNDATKSSIVNEPEEEVPTEGLQKSAKGIGKKSEDIASKISLETERKQGPTASSKKIENSTPTKQTASPTTVAETPQVTKASINSSRAPSLKPTSEAASTAAQPTDGASSGSGMQNSEKDDKVIDKTEVKKAGKVEATKINGDSVSKGGGATAMKNGEGEEDSSGDEDGGARNGIENDEEQPQKDIEKRILCVGDSITEGYYKGGTSFHPYSKKLSELLNAEKNHVSYIVYNEGKSGECVNPAMTKKMPQLIDKYKRLDLAIIIGGTNDFTKERCNDADLFNDIKSLHEMVHKEGGKTVAVTIPDSNAPKLPGRNEREKEWENVNDKLRAYAKENEKVILCDLAEELPFRTMDDDERKLLWDDDLHYTPMGYDKMAEIIYDVIQGNF